MAHSTEVSLRQPGEQQGDVFGVKTYEIGKHPVVDSTLKYEKVSVCLSPDNVFLLAKLTMEYPAAKDLCVALSKIGCEL